MFFKTVEANIEQIKAVVDSFGKCYFHGDGNLYDNEADSDFRKNFSNPGVNGATSPSAYRVLFTNKSQVPESVEEINAMLTQSFASEQAEASRPKAAQGVKTVKVAEVEKSQAQKEDEQLQKEIAAEEAAKKTKK
jgi:hypothetical protein